ncbi:hypothetical protein HPB47_012374 [Ixodes persulcatus]|uniref:Uncharacterized protein n=1 Tax=Ixodes persulcatus TaxID=34615 RepID=A0AC60NTQ7_IXOPE|nr:hypothetical protein HPB47_012374 [Ixodes persulcatus]
MSMPRVTVVSSLQFPTAGGLVQYVHSRNKGGLGALEAWTSWWAALSDRAAPAEPRVRGGVDAGSLRERRRARRGDSLTAWSAVVRGDKDGPLLAALSTAHASRSSRAPSLMEMD